MLKWSSSALNIDIEFSKGVASLWCESLIELYGFSRQGYVFPSSGGNILNPNTGVGSTHERQCGKSCPVPRSRAIDDSGMSLSQKDYSSSLTLGRKKDKFMGLSANIWCQIKEYSRAFLSTASCHPSTSSVGAPVLGCSGGLCPAWEASLRLQSCCIKRCLGGGWSDGGKRWRSPRWPRALCSTGSAKQRWAASSPKPSLLVWSNQPPGFHLFKRRILNDSQEVLL